MTDVTGVAAPRLDGNSLVLRPRCLKIRGIATPACALVRNDRAFSNSPIFRIFAGGIFTLDNFRERRYNISVDQVKFGLVAQLGAHHIRIVGVVGSNPIRSIKNTIRFPDGVFVITSVIFVPSEFSMKPKRPGKISLPGSSYVHPYCF